MGIAGRRLVGIRDLRRIAYGIFRFARAHLPTSRHVAFGDGGPHTSFADRDHRDASRAATQQVARTTTRIGAEARFVAAFAAVGNRDWLSVPSTIAPPPQGLSHRLAGGSATMSACRADGALRLCRWQSDQPKRRF